MSDLVERLRDKAQWLNDLGLQDEAADEIERLRELLANAERALAAFNVEREP